MSTLTARDFLDTELEDANYDDGTGNKSWGGIMYKHETLKELIDHSQGLLTYDTNIKLVNKVLKQVNILPIEY